ncbi:MAG: site-specific integrase, partial [Ruminococcus sp.]|nr:site-specific integrase [Ruminococcus sp.]
MSEEFLTGTGILKFRRHLMLEERSAATVGKYVRDATAFAAYARGRKVTKETVIAYKQHLLGNYAARSVNSMLASLN